MLRLLVIILILPLLENDNFKFREEKYEQQNIGVIIDNSKSISNKYSIIEINNILDSISNWGSNNDLNLYWYNLDSLINREDLVLDNNYTNFSSISKFPISNNLDQLIILSDGNINQGPSINNLSFSDDMIINSIGLGSINDNQNATIMDINTNSNQDSVISNIKIKINSNLNNQKALFNIYSNNYENIIYSDTITIMKGDYFLDKKITLDYEDINNKLIYSLDPLTFSNTDKNITDWEINFNKNKIKILLLTGAINYNTGFLKNILGNNTDFELVHNILFDNNNLSFENFDYIILDNFFESKEQFDLIADNSLSAKSILFFEGINSKSGYIKSLFEMEGYNENYSYLNHESKNKDILIDGINMGSINTDFSLFLNDNSKISNKISFFSDSSLALFESNNIFFILIPNISEIDFYLKNKNNNDYISKYISFLIKEYFNNYPINLKLNKSNYLKGEKISFSIDYDMPFIKETGRLIIQNINTGDIDSLIYNNEDIFLTEQGNYKVYFLYEGTNGKLINSNTETLSISDYSMELSKTSQNRYLLKGFSQDFNGKYVDISNFNQSYFMDFNILPNYRIYDYIFSALDIFIKDKIYLLVIILISVEIYLRKRIGLL